MWVKLDDRFATHPKLLEAGPLCLVIQIRAICYASQNQTDGFIPFASLPLLLTGFDDLGIRDEHRAIEVKGYDWPTEMIAYKLWESVKGGYQIHDYLKWNLSRSAIKRLKKKLSDAGRKGMQTRYSKDKSSVSKVITEDITNPVTKDFLSISKSISISKSSLSSSEIDVRFNKFWELYPKKIAKGAALRSWKKIKPANGLFEKICQQVEAAKQTDQWQREGGQYIPYASTWLNQSRWEDDYSQKTPIKKRDEFAENMGKLARGERL